MLPNLLTTSVSGFFVASLIVACAELPYQTANRTISNNTPSEQFSQKTTNSMFDWPVDEARLTRGFLPKAKGFHSRPHLGLDLAASRGTPIYAAHDGTVIYVGQEFSGYGRMIMIEGSGGWASFYAHLSATKIHEGERVQKGKIIGLMGRTGRATGIHLHFELRKNRNPVNPLLYLPHARMAAR